jgi:hypothetical protein
MCPDYINVERPSYDSLGSEMLFHSTRPGGYGNADIWISRCSGHIIPVFHEHKFTHVTMVFILFSMVLIFTTTLIFRKSKSNELI